jgi:hypothetical protein
MWYSTSDNNFHVFDGVTDRTLELAVLSTYVEANVASEVILAVNSLVILAFISLVTLVLLGFSASPACYNKHIPNNYFITSIY